MNTLQILQLLNTILGVVPSVVTLIDQIRVDANAGNSDAEVAAMLAQIDQNHAVVLALLGGE